MLYALLIHEAEEVNEERSEAERESALQAHRDLQAKAKGAGAFVEANQLMTSAAATTVRRQGDAAVLMDGPFAETKEIFVGLYVLDCPNLEAAIAYARLIPIAGSGGVEVRPIAYFEAAPPAGEP